MHTSQRRAASTEGHSENLHVPVDLLGLPVATQQAAQDPHAVHPVDFLGHTSVGRTLSLTLAGKKQGKHLLQITPIG